MPSQPGGLSPDEVEFLLNEGYLAEAAEQDAKRRADHADSLTDIVSRAFHPLTDTPIGRAAEEICRRAVAGELLGGEYAA